MASVRPLIRLSGIIGAGVLAGSLVACGSSAGGSGTAGDSSSSKTAASNDPIKVGQTLGLTGPAGAYGKAIADAQSAWIKYTNAHGGVNGRPIALTNLDDGLDPAKAVANARTLVSQGSVAILDGDGAGSIDALVPVLANAKVPFLFPAKSSNSWVDTPSPYTFAIVPTFRDQELAIIKEAFKRTGPGSVYLVATQSPETDAVIAAAKSATQAGGGQWLGNNVVPFGASNVTPFALQAAAGHPDYVLFESAPAETTKITAALTQSGQLPKKGILGLTSMPGETFTSGTTSAAQKLVLSISTATPPSDEVAKPCVDALAQYSPSTKPDMVSVAGCLEADLLVNTLKRVEGAITPASVHATLDAINNVELSKLIPPVSFSPTNHMGMHAAPVVTIENGVWVSSGTVDVPVVPGS